MKPCINSFAVGLICLFSLPLWATDAARKDYGACLAQWDQKLHTLQTQFIQTTEYDGLTISQSLGRISYAQDGSKLRLDTLEEGQVTQTALTDKKKIYILDEKGKEISVVSWQQWLQGQPNQVLFDFGNYAALLAKHRVALEQENKDTVTLRLTPNNKKENYILFVTLNAANCFVRDIALVSDLMTTKAQLTNVQINASLSENTFKGLK